MNKLEYRSDGGGGGRRNGGDNAVKKGWRGEERDGEGEERMAGGRRNSGGKKKWRGKEERNRMESGLDRKKEAFHVEIEINGKGVY